jgi:hypothetical protein
MNARSRLGLLLASAMAAAGLTLAAPVAVAATPLPSSTVSQVVAADAATTLSHCKAKHSGKKWKWHGEHKGKGHWDHKHGKKWHHHYDDKRYCKH